MGHRQWPGLLLAGMAAVILAAPGVAYGQVGSDGQELAYRKFVRVRLEVSDRHAVPVEGATVVWGHEAGSPGKVEELEAARPTGSDGMTTLVVQFERDPKPAIVWFQGEMTYTDEQGVEQTRKTVVNGDISLDPGERDAFVGLQFATPVDKKE